MTELFVNFVQILIILFRIKRIESLFVSVGDYSNESIPGLNSPECGLSVKPFVFELSLNNKCFKSIYENKTLVLFDTLKINPKVSQRVYKGEDVRHAYESPWAVFVGPTHWFRNARVCTGVLITPHWVLTAAHCFDDMKNYWFVGVVLNMGSNKKKGTHEIKIEPKDFYTHPMYTNPSLPNRTEPLTNRQQENIRTRHDIALIRVSSGFIPDTLIIDNRYFINTICLPKRDELNFRSENATYYGYGRIVLNESIYYPEYLQKGWVELSPFIMCEHPTLLCGRYLDDNPRPCKGDSGGPLVQYIPGVQNRAVLVGTLGGGYPMGVPCSNLVKVTYWMAVSKHIDWILKTMKENHP